MRVFAGIDLAVAKNKRLPVCLCKFVDGQLLPLPLTERNAPSPPRGRGNIACVQRDDVDQFVEETAQYLRDQESYFGVEIIRIGIDAPSAPRKLNISRRLAEAALDRHKISCFTTPSAAEFEIKKKAVQAHLKRGGTASTLPAANQLWMLVGFALFARLQEEWECLEVYPQATMHSIGAADVHKGKSDGLDIQAKAVARYTRWNELGHFPQKALKSAAFGPSHDGLDAFSSAWVASLEPHEREALGCHPNDAIWVPAQAKLRTIEKL